MADMSLVAQRLQQGDHDRKMGVLSAAFFRDASKHMLAHYRKVYVPERSHGVFVADELAGVGDWLPFEITTPGGGSCPMAGITMVAVLPSHRRKGVLTALLREQMSDFRAAGVPLAGLYASEGTIYGRFGYAPAVFDLSLSIPRAAAFQSTVECDPRPAREVPYERGMDLRAEQHPEIATGHVGWLRGDQESWRVRVIEYQVDAQPDRALRFAAHPDGYVLYQASRKWTQRGPDYELAVLELAASTPAAYATLWRYLLDLDLVGEVSWQQAALDEPVLTMLADPRQATRSVADGLWLRLVELDRALESRTYSAPADVTLEVTDAFCPWNAGRWRLRVDADGVAEVRRTEEPAQVNLDVADLASCYLGAISIASLHRSGRVAERKPGAVRALSRAFATEVAPQSPDPF